MNFALFFANSRGSDLGNFVVSVVSWVSLLALIVTVIEFRLLRKQKDRTGAARLLVFWTIVPPLWFWIEYHWIWKSLPSVEQHLERFVHSQECSRNIWLGIVGLLAALYVGHPESPPEVQASEKKTD